MTLSGCGGVLYGAATDDPGPPFALPGPSRLRIAIFEIEQLRFPFHVGLIIHSPEQRILYDPAGYWRNEEATRIRDVTYGLTPELEAIYLSRDTVMGLPWRWTLHLFETEVPDGVARKAIAIAQNRKPLPFGFCAPGTVTLLHRLPGFEDLPMNFLPSVLLSALQARDDLDYSRERLRT